MAWRQMGRTSGDDLEAGDRDRSITLQKRPVTDAVGDDGFPVETWTTLVAEMPASKQDLGGQEQFRSAQESAAFDTRWVINYRADMDPELLDVPKLRRVVYQRRVFDIVAADHLGRRAGIELLTLAGSRLP